ncbi:ribosome silencing factor, partial [Vibrio parahaemolyticus]|nr:ribosome silencing factor [Vibrio parahaemolyticus]
MLREELKDFLADKADDMKAEDIVILNVEDK